MICPYTVQIGESDDGEYDLMKDGERIGTMLFYEDAKLLMRLLNAHYRKEQNGTASTGPRPSKR